MFKLFVCGDKTRVFELLSQLTYVNEFSEGDSEEFGLLLRLNAKILEIADESIDSRASFSLLSRSFSLLNLSVSLLVDLFCHLSKTVSRRIGKSQEILSLFGFFTEISINGNRGNGCQHHKSA